MLKFTQNNTFGYEFVLILLCRLGLKKLPTVSEDILFHRLHFRVSGGKPVKIKKSPADKLRFSGPKVNNLEIKICVIPFE
jgi:hypothetical protein